MPGPGSLLLVTHVHVRQGSSGPLIDAQTAAGIAQWCRRFDSVTYYGIADEWSQGQASSNSWVDTTQGLLGEKARVIALPYGYRPGRMLRHYAAVRAEMRAAVATHRHLCFTLGEMIGDWPAIAALEAIRQKRDFAAWIDRVEPFIIRNRLADAPVRRRLADAAMVVTQAGVRHILRRSTVALLQGGDTFDHYAAAAPNPHCTYDTHTTVDEQIAPAALAAKQARIRSGAPLEILYAGRAAAMKGPFDWLEVLARLDAAGVPFRARWIGDGPDLPAMRERAAALGLAGQIAFPGFVQAREALLAALQAGDLLLFCHKTPESARCLIEALVCGCPIVGYDTAYPRRLCEERGGSALAPQNDVAALAARVGALHADREGLARLVGQAADSGTLYNEDAVYARRAELMRLG